MERDAGRSPASVTDDLLANPSAYSFFQAVRLLRHHADKGTSKGLEEFFRNHLRTRPQLSLGFPATDLTKLETADREGEKLYNLEATFLGLYGASSPLPTFYTEELLEEASEDRSVSRDFLDILNNDFYVQFFRAWSRSRLMIKTVDEQDAAWLERLNCLLGFGHQETLEQVPESCRRFRHIGLLTQYPRSGLGLQTLLKDGLELDNVRVRQCVHRTVGIPEDQQCLLGMQGNRLGDRCLLGEELDDRNGKCAIEVRDLDAAGYHDLLPESPGGKTLANLVRGYLVEPLEYDLVLTLRPEETHTTVLGGETWSGLGNDTWIFSGTELEHTETTFPGKSDRMHTDPLR